MIDADVAAVIDEVEAFQKSRSDAWNVPREEGMILYAVAVLGGCRRIAEVGTSYGFSGLFLGAGARANGGRLDTFDINPDKHRYAAVHFRKAGLFDVVVLHTGDAAQGLDALEPGVDFAFLDATKSETLDYWRTLEPKLAPRCVIAVDNTATHSDVLAPFLDMLRTRGDFACCDIPVEHGLELAVRAG